jgi:hypothetical protein
MGAASPDMGAELAKLAALVHRDLDGNAFKVLNRMAWTALDKPKDGRPPRLYFGGWEPLAHAMGHDVPPDDRAPDSRRVRKKLASYVATAMSKLVRAGAVEPIGGKARAGHRQTYRLTFDLVPHSMGYSSTPLDGSLSTPLDGVQQHPTEWDQSTPLDGVPRKEEDPREDLPEDTTPPGRQSSHRRTELVAHEFPADRDECDLCPLPASNAIHRRAS